MRRVEWTNSCVNTNQPLQRGYRIGHQRHRLVDLALRRQQHWRQNALAETGKDGSLIS
jgi:hypothetical protein